jgi:Glyoxalase-like domain
MESTMTICTELDHIVVACNTLDEGRAWCRELLGVEAAPGGKHANVGTHNVLVGLAAEHYLEIIAIDPEGLTPAFPRWFGLDTEDVKALIRNEPRLVGWVARVPRIGANEDAIHQLAALPTNPANVIRPAQRGEFRWRFAFTRDGSRPKEGVLPYFIQREGSAHPCDRLPDVGVSLSSLVLGDPVPEKVGIALDAIGFSHDTVCVGQSASPRLIATLATPLGRVVLD